MVSGAAGRTITPADLAKLTPAAAADSGYVYVPLTPNRILDTARQRRPDRPVQEPGGADVHRH